MSPDIDRSAAELLRSPVGCAFLELIAVNELAPSEAVRPHFAFALAARAVDICDPHGAFRPLRIEQALDLGAPHADLAHALLREAGAEWWGAPSDGAQIWIGYGGAPGASRDEPPPHSERWETYGQRPTGWQFTSTVRDGVASLDYVARGGGDWILERLSHASIEPSADARVYEIVTAEDWHALCMRYPSAVRAGADSPGADGTIAPSWRAVEADWAGVHLTFLGLLSALHVRVESQEGATMLWSWDSEGTMWLRPERLTPSAPPRPLVDSPDPRSRWQPSSGPFVAPPVGAPPSSAWAPLVPERDD